MHSEWFNKLSVVLALAVFVLEGANGLNYLACFRENSVQNRLLKGGMKEFRNSLTPEICQFYCRTKEMKYFGLQNSYECFCSHELPSYTNVVNDVECNMKCEGSSEETCGGALRLSVYDSEEDFGTATYIGCYKERSIQARLMTGAMKEFRLTLTIEVCIDFCRKRNFAYAGTQYSYECFCSNERPHFKSSADDEDCGAKCDGNHDQRCGGNNRLSIHDLQDKSLSAGTDHVYSNFLGCYEISSYQRHLLPDKVQDSDEHLTPESCVGYCYRRGYRYAGMESGRSCFCGNYLDSNSKVNDRLCSSTCSGDKKLKCGGSRKLSVYHTEISDQSEEGRLLGCFTDSGELRTLSGLQIDFKETNTPRLCFNVCLQLGFQYAGVQYGIECFCGNRRPSTKAEKPEIECSMPCPGDRLKMCGGGWRLLVFNTGGEIPAVTPTTNRPATIATTTAQQRPHTTPTAGRPLKPLTVRTEPTTTQRTVDTTTTRRPPRGTVVPSTSPSLFTSATWWTSDLQCDSCTTWPPSTAISSQRPSPISISTPPFPQTTKKQHTQPFTTQRPTTPQKLPLNQRPTRPAEQKVPLETKIPKEPQSWSTNLNENAPSSQQNVFNQQQSGNFRPQPTVADLITDQPSCVPSVTEVRGKTRCRGETIFHDDFSSSKINNFRWTHEVIMPWSPDYEFVVYRKNIQNTFVRNKKLHIKPRLLEDDFVKRGVMDLESCTGLLHSEECRRQGATFNIIPPVESARLTTKESFSFKYGKVEITAKLPLGDWIVPEIWLEPKRKDYGTGAYASGRVRIAMARGNPDLLYEGRQIGNRQLEAGILMGVPDNIRARTIIRDKVDGWWSSFHNYTLLWTPDNLQFLVDGQYQESLTSVVEPLYRLAGFDDELGSVWRSGSSIAPFDKEFYITLGLSVGGMRDFPDDCISSGREKPWRNMAVKGMASFWEDREHWVRSWSENDSALQVERVTVTAL